MSSGYQFPRDSGLPYTLTSQSAIEQQGQSSSSGSFSGQNPSTMSVSRENMFIPPSIPYRGINPPTTTERMTIPSLSYPHLFQSSFSQPYHSSFPPPHTQSQQQNPSFSQPSLSLPYTPPQPSLPFTAQQPSLLHTPQRPPLPYAPQQPSSLLSLLQTSQNPSLPHTSQQQPPLPYTFPQPPLPYTAQQPSSLLSSLQTSQNPSLPHTPQQQPPLPYTAQQPSSLLSLLQTSQNSSLPHTSQQQPPLPYTFPQPPLPYTAQQPSSLLSSLQTSQNSSLPHTSQQQPPLPYTFPQPPLPYTAQQPSSLLSLLQTSQNSSLPHTSQQQPPLPYTFSQPPLPYTAQQPLLLHTPQRPPLTHAPQQPPLPYTPQQPSSLLSLLQTSQNPSLTHTPQQQPPLPYTSPQPSLPYTPQQPSLLHTLLRSPLTHTSQQLPLPYTPPKPPLPYTPPKPPLPYTPQQPSLLHTLLRSPLPHTSQQPSLPYTSQQRDPVFRSQPTPFQQFNNAHSLPKDSHEFPRMDIHGGYQPYRPMDYQISGAETLKMITGHNNEMQNSILPYDSEFSPTVHHQQEFNAIVDAKIIDGAIKEVSDKEKTITRILANRTNKHRQHIAIQFESLFKKNLVKLFKSKLLGNYKSLILAMMTPVMEFYASELHDAINDTGIDVTAVIEILGPASNFEIGIINQIYLETFRRRLQNDLKYETVGYFKSLMVLISMGNRDESSFIDDQAAMADAMELKKIGILDISSDNSLLNVILAQRNISQMEKIFEAYEKITGLSIEEKIENDFPADIKDGLLSIVQCIQDPAQFFAEQLYKSIENGGTYDRRLIRLVVTRSEFDMGEIKELFYQTYGKTLGEYISIDCYGDYRECLLALIS